MASDIAQSFHNLMQWVKNVLSVQNPLKTFFFPTKAISLVISLLQNTFVLEYIIHDYTYSIQLLRFATNELMMGWVLNFSATVGFKLEWICEETKWNWIRTSPASTLCDH